MDYVFIDDLRIDTVIGIYDWERRTRQTIALDGGWSTTKYLVPEALMAERVAPNPSKQPA